MSVPSCTFFSRESGRIWYNYREMTTDYDDVRFPPPGKTPREDTAAVMKFYKLPKAFPPAVMKEARAIGAAGVGGSGYEGRLDLRRKFIFTCDPVTARDYDDALSLETDRKGNRVLGVHIADVSHYVRPGSAIDREAYRRSTSVYLCDKVVPMLPEELCNGVCSLVPDEDRLAFSVFITFDREGEMVHRSFAKSVIRSKARFTYEQVMNVIGGGRLKEKSAEKTIRAISALAQQLRAKRFALGALDLEVPEAEVTLDANGEMTGIVTRPYDESHQMIEECMVAANEAVAKELWTRGVKILARLHEAPDPEKILLLRSELRGLGVKMGNIENPKVFGQFLKSIKRHPLYPTLSTMVLRSMKKAVYDSTTMGHFGLAKKFYAHFTSPIRRYPDLVLHRQLASWIAGEGGRLDLGWLNTAALHCSEREQNADDAERSLDEIKKFRFLQQVLDNPASGLDNCFEAVVSKCTRYGLFVDLPDLAVGGMVHVSLLSNSYVRWNDFNETLEGGGKVWKPGTKMNVRVEKIDFDRRLIDFAPVRPGRRS